MSDIVRTLRLAYPSEALSRKAADEIESLRQRVEAQKDDIITIGMEVGKATKRAEKAEAKLAEAFCSGYLSGHRKEVYRNPYAAPDEGEAK